MCAPISWAGDSTRTPAQRRSPTTRPPQPWTRGSSLSSASGCATPMTRRRTQPARRDRAVSTRRGDDSSLANILLNGSSSNVGRSPGGRAGWPTGWWTPSRNLAADTTTRPCGGHVDAHYGRLEAVRSARNVLEQQSPIVAMIWNRCLDWPGRSGRGFTQADRHPRGDGRDQVEFRACRLARGRRRGRAASRSATSAEPNRYSCVSRSVPQLPGSPGPGRLCPLSGFVAAGGELDLRLTHRASAESCPLRAGAYASDPGQVCRRLKQSGRHELPSSRRYTRTPGAERAARARASCGG